jgi:hypothetical protein
MILSLTDFDNVPYKIPNQNESAWLADYIEMKETECLKEILGIALYNDFIDAIENYSPGSIPSPYDDLLNGAEYTYQGYTFEWVGMVKALRPAVYSQWLIENYRKKTNSGTIVNLGQQNTESVVPAYDVTKSWNKWVDFIGSDCNMYNTMYGYLYVNKDSFEVNGTLWLFTRQWSQNQFGL